MPAVAAPHHEVEKWAGMLLSVGQALLWLRAPKPSLADHAHQAILVSGALAITLMAWLAPHQYQRCRAWMVPLLRVGTHLMPVQRSTLVSRQTECSPNQLK